MRFLSTHDTAACSLQLSKGDHKKIHTVSFELSQAATLENDIYIYASSDNGGVRYLCSPYDPSVTDETNHTFVLDGFLVHSSERLNITWANSAEVSYDVNVAYSSW